MAAYEF
jgi:hypothetical protein